MLDFSLALCDREARSTQVENCCRATIGDTSSHRVEDEFTSELAAQFTALSVQEREAIIEEIHGVSPEPKETKESRELLLRQMRLELQKIPMAHKTEYTRAVFLRPTLEKDDAFLLRFLRAERYNPKAAALKVCLHFEHKLEIFPPEMLPRRITLYDLTEEDIETMRSCALHQIKCKDRTGRAVHLIQVKNINPTHWKSQFRYLHYQAMAMLDDEETQIKGLIDVFILHGLTGMKSSWLESIRKGLHYPSGYSVRRCGLHLCYDNPALRSVIALIQRMMPLESNLRERFHFGSMLECQYALRSFGINLVRDDIMHITADQEVHVDFDLYFAERERLDRAIREQELNEDDGFILYPQPRDILMGRGKPYQEYMGNVRLTSVIADYVDQYRLLDDKMDKTVLSMKIVQDLREEGCRFLKRTDDGWVVADDQQARGKVVACLRNGAKKQRDTEDTARTSPAHDAKRMRLDKL